MFESPTPETGVSDTPGPSSATTTSSIPSSHLEADPSVVNLSTIETFYPEHRPFFLDGAGTFHVDFNCMAFLCANEALFYSRRVASGGRRNSPPYTVVRLMPPRRSRRS